jgi:hypothetical protein
VRTRVWITNEARLRLLSHVLMLVLTQLVCGSPNSAPKGICNAVHPFLGNVACEEQVVTRPSKINAGRPWSRGSTDVVQVPGGWPVFTAFPSARWRGCCVIGCCIRYVDISATDALLWESRSGSVNGYSYSRLSQPSAFPRNGSLNTHNHTFLSRNTTPTAVCNKCLGGNNRPSPSRSSLSGACNLNNYRKVLDDAPLAMRQTMWVLHDGAPAHFSRSVIWYI